MTRLNSKTWGSEHIIQIPICCTTFLISTTTTFTVPSLTTALFAVSLLSPEYQGDDHYSDSKSERNEGMDHSVCREGHVG